ncbi:MAG: tetratricopeptide repeat protein [candidate division Zixibacteria bacterium]|nr:tetratricopeptide repeat protein [candidate division Zixibacteria bacterium]MDH3938845.1 tetratricopeptide repeat protein [candidate division Zixibacteria bacterium]
MNCKAVVLVFLLGLLVLAGCSSKTVGVHPAAAESPQASTSTFQLSPDLDPERIDPRAFHYYANAVIFELAGHIPEAAEGYKRALQYHPDSYEIRYSFARMLMYLKNFVDIPEALEVIDPKDGDVYSLLATAYRSQGLEDSARWAYLHVVAQDSLDRRAYAHLASFYHNAGDMDSVLWAYHNMARLEPSDPALQYELGKMYAQRGDNERAREHLRKSIELEPTKRNILAFVRLADLYQITQQPDSASATLQAALAAAPDDLIINRYLANYYLELDSLHNALKYVSKLTELEPGDRSVKHRLGLIYFGLDSLSRSKAIFASLVETGEAVPANHFYLGRIAIMEEDFVQARDEFIEFTQLIDTVAQGWLDLGFTYSKLGQRENEIGAYQTGLARVREPEERTRMLFALGATYERAGEIDSSVSIFEELLVDSPDHAGAMNYLGYMLCDRGERLQYARTLIEKAVAQDPDNPAFLDSYGWVFYRLGEYSQALPHLKQAAELDNDPVILDHLGDTYKALNDLEQARQWWLKALQEDPDNEGIKKKLGQ